MRLTIVTPERNLFDAEVDQVTIPTAEGEITVLPHHVPLVGVLLPGELTIKQGSATIPLVVSGGFLQVSDNMVKVLADTAERVEELIEERAVEAHKRAEAMLNEKHLDATEYATLAAKLQKESARLRVIRKHHNKSSHI